MAARSGNRTLGIFVESAQELRKARLEPETARELCVASGADAVLVIHCAWSVKATGGVAQARPSSRVTVSLWGADGTQSFVRRVDKQGEVSAGRGDLAPWFESYRQALRLALD